MPSIFQIRNSQSGFVSPLMLIGLAALGLLAFILISSSLPLNSNLSNTYPKDSAKAAENLTFTPTEDAYVNSKFASRNFGSALTLQIANNNSRVSYIKFDVKNITSPILTVKLKLYATNASLQTGGSIYRVDNNWSESAINYNNKPALGQKVIDLPPVTSGSYVEADLKSLVTINGIYSIAIVTNSSDDARYASSEATNAPQLNIVTQGTPPVLTSTPTPTPQSGTINTPTPNPDLSGTSLEYGTWLPNPTYDTCTKAQHDAYFVIGPDGLKYSTWHPSIGPGGCKFGHDHGLDPRTSAADNTLPAFDYASQQAGIAEPHVGFKVFIMKAGTPSTDGTIGNADARVVGHMGTGGVKRYNTQFHSIEYDYIARDGSGKEFHITGLADTNPASLNGSTCVNPRSGGKDFSSVGCDDPYEIWNNVHFGIRNPGQNGYDALNDLLYVSGSWAVFDPITTRDPADITKLIYSQNYYETIANKPAGFVSGIDPLSPNSYFTGCKRESYFGPNYIANSGGQTVYYTDSYGYLKSGPGPGIIKQEVKAIKNTNNVIFKYSDQSDCPAGSGVHTPN